MEDLEKINFIYLRTSTEEQNPENQLRDCQNLCAKINIVDGFVIEDKTSAWTEYDREGFNKVIAKIKARRVNHLVCWDIDRLYRNRKKLIAFFELCKNYDVKINSFRQQWLNDIQSMPSPWNEIVYDLMLQIMGWIAEEESNKKSDRVKNAVRIKDDVTFSYKGNKWGRKQLSSQKKNQMVELVNKVPPMTMREIANELGISIGVVHKYYHLLKEEKSTKNDEFIN